MDSGVAYLQGVFRAAVRVRRSMVVGLLLVAAVTGCGIRGGESERNLSDTHALILVLMGATGSDVAERDVNLDHLADPVVPKAVALRARLIVGVVSDRSFIDPVVLADVDFNVEDEDRDNPVRHDRLIEERRAQLLDDVRGGLERLKPAPASDPFGAFAWAQSELDQVPADTKLLVSLNDAVATVERCNLTVRDLSPTNRPLVIGDCTGNRLPDLNGVEVWQGGIAFDKERGLSEDRAQLIRDLYREFWPMTGARLTIFGPTLVPLTPRRG